jgi:hypothetical protein
MRTLYIAGAAIVRGHGLWKAQGRAKRWSPVCRLQNRFGVWGLPVSGLTGQEWEAIMGSMAGAKKGIRAVAPVRLLIDTCVWLDIAKDYKDQALIGAIEDLCGAEEIELVVPRVVVDEFARNKARNC